MMDARDMVVADDSAISGARDEVNDFYAAKGRRCTMHDADVGMRCRNAQHVVHHSEHNLCRTLCAAVRSIRAAG